MVRDIDKFLLKIKENPRAVSKPSVRIRLDSEEELASEKSESPPPELGDVPTYHPDTIEVDRAVDRVRYDESFMILANLLDCHAAMGRQANKECIDYKVENRDLKYQIEKLQIDLEVYSKTRRIPEDHGLELTEVEKIERELADCKIARIENRLKCKWLKRRIDACDCSDESDTDIDDGDGDEEDDDEIEDVQPVETPIRATTARRPQETMVWKILHSTTFHMLYISTSIAIIVFFLLAHSNEPQNEH